MSEKLNISTKGETNVTQNGGFSEFSDFDICEAGVKRSWEADWDDFEAWGANNREESEYSAPIETEIQA